MLQVISAGDAECTWHDAPRLLRGEPPFVALQLRGVLVVRMDGHNGFVRGMERFGPFAAALADAAPQPALMDIYIRFANGAAGCDGRLGGRGSDAAASQAFVGGLLAAGCSAAGAPAC